MAEFDHLRLIAPPPAEPGPRIDWARAEAALGLSLPQDYVTLVDEWGAGSFDEFVWVFAPGGSNQHLDLLRQTERQLSALRELVEAGDECPYEPRVSSGGLLPWGVSDNGDVFFWHLKEVSAPETWIVVVNESRGPEWHSYEGAIVDFLVVLLAGQQMIPFFPDDFPSDNPGFSRAR